MSTPEHPSYSELLEKSSGRLSYDEKLSCSEWHDKRNIIIERDGKRCRSCGTSHKLEVHHTFYVRDCLPWEYPNDSDGLPSEESKDSLITLCNNCHENWHEKYTPLWYRRLRGSLVEDTKLTKCKRCKGKGWFLKYKHICDGICFKCRGARYEELQDQSLSFQIDETIQDNYEHEDKNCGYDDSYISENKILIFLQQQYKERLQEWLDS